MMWKRSAMHGVVLAVAVVLSAPATAADDGWQARVGEALGKTGSAMPGDLPRWSAAHRSEGHARRVELKPGFALGGWLAFEPMGEQAMVMGDLVLTMDEVSPVMKSSSRAALG